MALLIYLNQLFPILFYYNPSILIWVCLFQPRAQACISFELRFQESLLLRSLRLWCSELPCSESVGLKIFFHLGQLRYFSHAYALAGFGWQFLGMASNPFLAAIFGMVWHFGRDFQPCWQYCYPPRSFCPVSWPSYWASDRLPWSNCACWLRCTWLNNQGHN